MNPWNSTTLEWTIPSPPPFDNFAGVHPVVNHGPYEYSVPGAPQDFIMQTDPPEVHSQAIAHPYEYGWVTHTRYSERSAAASDRSRMGRRRRRVRTAAASSRRASFTGLFVLLAASTMVFAAFTSAFVVRRGLSDDWATMPKPPILFVNTAVLLASSVVLEFSRRALKAGERSKFNVWWTIATVLGIAVPGRPGYAWRAVEGCRGLRLDQSVQFVFLRVDRRRTRSTCWAA